MPRLIEIVFRNDKRSISANVLWLGVVPKTNINYEN